jgi:hypothetical protein
MWPKTIIFREITYLAVISVCVTVRFCLQLKDWLRRVAKKKLPDDETHKSRPDHFATIFSLSNFIPANRAIIFALSDLQKS